MTFDLQVLKKVPIMQIFNYYTYNLTNQYKNILLIITKPGHRL